MANSLSGFYPSDNIYPREIQVVINNILRIVGGSITCHYSNTDPDIIILDWAKNKGGVVNHLSFALNMYQLTIMGDPSTLSDTFLQNLFKKYPEERAYHNTRNVTISPSRTYVAVCISMTGGYFFRKFKIPIDHDINNSEEASWYFLNKLDYTSMIQGCFTFEDFSNLKEVGSEFIS